MTTPLSDEQRAARIVEWSGFDAATIKKTIDGLPTRFPNGRDPAGHDSLDALAYRADLADALTLARARENDTKSDVPIPHTAPDATGRLITRYTGGPDANLHWMAPFMTNGISGRIDQRMLRKAKRESSGFTG